MSSLTSLSPEKMAEIRHQYFMKSSMLTDNEILHLARKVNQVVNLPFISEEKELIVFCRIVHWVDVKLYSLLPNEYYSLIRNSSDGISEDEADLIVERISPLIAGVVDIPFVPEAIEKRVIALILSLIINAMIKGFKLEN